MENPFTFGEPARGKYFINRKKELERLKNYIKNSKNVIIYSPRRYGKTSLVLQAMEEIKGEILPIFIDCYSITSEKELAAKISKEVLRYYKGREILEIVKKLFKDLKPRITLKTSPEVEIEVDYEGKDDWIYALDLPQKLALDKKKPVAVAFDEFQELAKFENLLKVLRSKFQHHNKVSYIFVGSKRGMMEWIFKSEESPFYNFGAHISLKEIPKEEFKEYILNAFSKNAIKISDETIDVVLSTTKCHPYYTQRLCFELWYIGKLKGGVDEEDISKVLNEMLADLEDSYLPVWESLTPNQRKALLAIVKGEEDIFSGEFLRKYDFKSPASVQSAVKKLTEKEIVERKGGVYRVTDTFFEYWLKKRFMNER